MKMRTFFTEGSSRLDELSMADAPTYAYELANKWTETHEFSDGTGGRLPFPIERTKYTFEAGNGLQYMVNCNLQNHELETSFGVLRQGFDANGAGDAIRVFATVMKILGDYVRADPPREINFTAKQSEPSRVKLYDRMFRNPEAAPRPNAISVNTFLPGYTLAERTPHGRNIQYVLKRPLTPEDAARDEQEAQEKAAQAAERTRARQEQEAARKAEQAARVQEPPMTQEEWDDLDALMNELNGITARL